jgi:two-component system response regulator AtoC
VWHSCCFDASTHRARVSSDPPMTRKLSLEMSDRARKSTAETESAGNRQPSAKSIPSLLVSCATGCWAMPLAGGRTYVIGRAPECDVAIDDPSVSRQHARLTTGAGFFVEDLSSTNGTRVQGTKVVGGERVRLELGAAFELGSATLLLHRGTPLDGSAKRRVVTWGEAVVHDPVMKRLYGILDVVAPTLLSVLILGETGVGKEVFAEALHRHSSRAKAPFLKLNCAALPDSILEAELFGYEKGAFTGAHQTKVGLFEAADGGTLFLDEVGEMTPSTQTKVLRAIESGELMRLGSASTRKVDVRFISAANRDLRKLVASGTFRADLFFRLNGIALTLPPLRKRVDDILPLAKHFMDRAAQKLGKAAPKLSAEVARVISSHSWPGNIRELRNVVDRAVVLCESDELSAADLLLHEEPSYPEAMGEQAPQPERSGDSTTVGLAPLVPNSGERPELRGKMEDFERETIVEALARTRGNQTQAAKLLGIARRTLIKKIVRYGIERRRATPNTGQVS